MSLVHPTAIVDTNAKIASDVIIGPFTVIESNVVIGSGCKIHNHVTITGNTKIGKNNIIHPYSAIGVPPQDISYADELTELVIGDRNVVRENCTVSIGTIRGSGITSVGSDNLIMAYSHIAHDCKIGNHILMANGAQLAGHVLIEDYATLGGFSLIHQFVRIGRNSFTSMGSAVNLDLPPYCLASGNYARAIGLNKVGLRRFGMKSKTLDALSRAFRMLVQRRFEPNENELSELSREHVEVKNFVSFIKSSKRGTIRTHLKART
jgi:UDP-N-acetylglucosamine acyltransferase